MKITTLICGLIFGVTLNAQNKIDSLKSLLKPGIDTTRINLLNSIAKEFLSSDPDSSLYYTDVVLTHSKKINFPSGSVKALMTKSTVFRKRGLVDTVMHFYEQALSIATANKLTNECGEINLWKGYMLQNQGLYDKSLECLISAEKFLTKSGNVKMLGRNFWLVGNTHLKLKAYKEAKANFEKAKGFFGEVGDSLGYFDCVQNTALVLMQEREFISALTLLESSERFYRKVNHVGALSAALVNKSEVLSNINRFYDAEKAVMEALELKKIVGMPSGIAYCYASLGEINFELKNFSKAEEYFKTAIDYARKDNSIEIVATTYNALYTLYKEKKDFAKALQYHEYYFALNDSMFNSEKNRTIEEMKTKFDTEKKDNELLLKDAALEKQNVEAKQKALQRNVLIAGLLITLVLAAFIFKSLNEKKKSNKIILQQKHLVEEKQKEILDSINYAKKIQYTLLAHDEFMQSVLKNYFVLFQPKDIVSGDFYWATQKDQKFFLAVCDSTGHGVPGAFMSLLNISFLNEAIIERNILSPAEIFNHVRNRLVESISKDGQQDGFDGILLCLDFQSKRISYAAANNSPVVTGSSGIQELPCDRMPVGISGIKQPFREFEINPDQFDYLYLYTDGYADQFGGPRGKKFKYKQLNEMLASLYTFPPEKQKEQLLSGFHQWKGDLEQIDDVCVLGISLGDVF